MGKMTSKSSKSFKIFNKKVFKFPLSIFCFSSGKNYKRRAKKLKTKNYPTIEHTTQPPDTTSNNQPNTRPTPDQHPNTQHLVFRFEFCSNNSIIIKSKGWVVGLYRGVRIVGLCQSFVFFVFIFCFLFYAKVKTKI